MKICKRKSFLCAVFVKLKEIELSNLLYLSGSPFLSPLSIRRIKAFGELFLGKNEIVENDLMYPCYRLRYGRN